MSYSADHLKRPVEQYGEYLRLIAKLELDPRLRPDLDPSDAVQQTMLKAVQKWEQFRGQTEAELLAWLRAILLNHLTDETREFLRRHPDRHHHSLEQLPGLAADGIVADDTSPSQRAIRHELWINLAEALKSLPDDQRTALELRHLRSLPIPDICARMGRSTAAVAGLLRRGLETLREVLDKSQ